MSYLRRKASLATLLVAGLLWLNVAPAAADIYKYVDEDGVMHFTNTPTGSEYRLYLKESTPRRPRAAVSSAVEDLIAHYASTYRLEKALVKAVIRVESNYNPRAVSPKGAQGMMQLIPSTARDMQVSDPFDPEDNIRGGTRYLRLMLDQFNDNIDLALAAYNAGPNAVRRHGGIPPFAETRNYVRKVKEFIHHYR